MSGGGWLDSIFSYLGTPQGSSLAGNVINAGSRIASTIDTTSANRDAAAQAIAGMRGGADTMSAAYPAATAQYSDAYRRALEAYTAAQRAAVGAYNTGADAAGSSIDTITTAASPAILALRQTATGNPNTLTPEQQIAYDDAQHRANNSLATGGLRGSGRATAAVLNDMNNRVRAGMVATNTSRADAARNLLSNQGFQATRDRANLDVQKGSVGAAAEQNIGNFGADTERSIGSRTADSTLASARGQAAAQEGSGVIGANATTANASQRAAATGDVGNIFAQTAKGFAGTNRPYYRDATTYGSGATGGSYGMRKGGRVLAPASIDTIRPRRAA